MFAYVGLSVVLAIPAFFLFGDTSAVPEVILVGYALVGMPLGMVWFFGGGALMAMVRALIAPRIFDEVDPLG